MEVFVYGTLTNEDTAAAVLDSYEFPGPATLVGLRRLEGRYPTLAPGGSVEGRLLRTPENDALDRYEGVADGLYVRVPVPRGTGTVQVYVGDPNRLGVEDRWPGNAHFESRVRSYLEDHEVYVRG